MLRPDQYGSAYLTTSGSYDGSPYLDLTDASQYQKGAILFSNKTTVGQFHLKFKTRINGASATPGDGFSINLAADLLAGTFFNEQYGYVPAASPGASRLVVAFNNDRLVNGVVVPAITVKWQGNVITNVLTSTGGIPPINSADGHWANVDLQLVPNGNLSLSYDGVVVFTNLVTGFVPVPSAQLGIAAQTGVNYETHWFDDIYISYTDGGVGPVGFANNPSLTNITVLENQTATFSVVPNGAAPFNYQWYFKGSAVVGATNSVLSIVGTPSTATNSTAGNYYVVLSNGFSSTNSATATLTVTADTKPPQLLSARILAFGNNQVVLTFNKPLDPTTATSLGTYNLGLLQLYSAALSADGLKVTLTTGTQERNQVYLFTITGLKDTTAAGNSLTTSGSFVTTVAGVADYAAQVLADGAVRYWRFDEPAGSLTAASLVTISDPIATGLATLNGGPTLGAASLIPAEPQDTSIGLSTATGDYLTVPNGADINTAGPYAQKSVEFWFNANTLPALNTTWLSAANTLFEEGGGTRGLAVYLWRDPASVNPDQAQLVFHAWNSASDGPGAPWGATGTNIAPAVLFTPAVYAQTSVQAGQTYHVVAVLNGDSVSTNGQLLLYVNGALVSTVGGVGQLYAHTSDIEIGRGATLLHDGSSGTTARFDGVLDDLSLYNYALSSNTVAQHYQEGTNLLSAVPPSLAVSRLDTLGNPGLLILTFDQPVSKTSSTNFTNYTLKNAVGTTLPIASITLLGGSNSVQLAGNYGFTVNSTYTLTVSNITDLTLTKTLTSNPTNIAFTFSASTGTTYSFSNGLPVGVQIAGNTYVTNSGGPEGIGFIDLTDATTNKNGVVLFTDRHDVTQAHIRFKARLSNGSSPAGAGFSVNLAPDLSDATFATPEAGYLVAPQTNRLTVSFNNSISAPPSISVLWWGTNITSVPTGTGGIPALNNNDGHWANVDINLLLNGLLSVSYDGVTVITNLATGFYPVIGAQVSLAADTTASAFETHWFDDVNLNFADGLIGPVTIPTGGQPQGNAYLENQPVSLSVTPQGTPPYAYQWYLNNAIIAGATNRTFNFIAHTNVAGNYTVTVANNFSSINSAVAVVAVQFDLTPAAVKKIVGYGGGVNTVVVTFNKPLSPSSATNVANFAINSGGLLIYSNQLSPDGITLTLFTGQQQNLSTNNLAINNLLNLAVNPTALNTNVTFRTGVSFYQEALTDIPVRYYRLDETNGTAINTDFTLLDTPAAAQGTIYAGTAVALAQNNVTFGVPALFTNSTGTAIQFHQANTNYIQFAAKEFDLTGTNTGNSSGIIFTNRTVEFWFRADKLPYASNYTDVFGNPAVTNHAYSLWTEGSTARYFNVYLYGTDTTTTNPSQAQLYVNSGNVANDGPGAYQQWGTLAGGGAGVAVYVNATVTTGQVYHVVAQLEGRADTNISSLGNPIGLLHLYTNGVWVGDSANPAGILYPHAGTTIAVGQGRSNFRHDGYGFGNETFEGAVDDIIIYNQLLSPDRIAAHYQAGLTPPLVIPAAVVSTNPPAFGSFSVSGGGLNITWTNSSAQLQRSTNVTGPFTTVTNATSPYHEPTTNARAFFRLVQ